MSIESTRYSIVEVTDAVRWEAYIQTRPEANFLQSQQWAAFEQALGKKTWSWGMFEGEQQRGALLIIKEQAKRGNYLTIAGGPLLDWTSPEVTKVFEVISAKLKELAKQENCRFVRIRPQALDSKEMRDLMKHVGWQESPMHLTADLTLQLDLTQSEEELLVQMRKNTRYEIRKAEKAGIEVTATADPAQIQEFYDHQVAVAKKHQFVPFSYPFLYEQFRVFATQDQALLFHAKKADELLASAFVIFYNQEAVYHYGISTPANHRLPGAHAAQWAAIKEAKRRGCTHYNFWGIAPENQPHHRFAGVSLFKRGFGGEAVQYLPAHDLPVSWQYSLTRGFELVRKKLRKL